MLLCWEVWNLVATNIIMLGRLKPSGNQYYNCGGFET